VLGWVSAFGLNVLGVIPWGRIKFPVVDLGEVVFQVRRLQLGYVPYRDTFTHHFLGYTLPFAGISSIFGLSPLVFKTTSVLFNYATAAFVWWILQDVADRKTAWLGVLLAVTVGWFWSWQGPAFNVQSYLTPLIAAELFLIVRTCLRQHEGWLYAGAGVAGVLFTFDQRGAAFLLPLVIAWIALGARATWRTALAALASFGLIPGICLALLWRAGAWPDFVEQTVIFPIFYRNQGVPTSLSAYLRTWFGSWPSAERIAVPLFGLSLCLSLFSERRAALVGIWVASSVAAAGAAAMGGRAYPNYFLLFGPITLVLVALLPWYTRRQSASLRGALEIGLVCFALCCALRPVALLAVTGSMMVPPRERVVEGAAAYLRDHTSFDDPVLVWGFAPQIYVLANRFNTFRDTGLLSVAGGHFSSMGGEGRLPHMVDEFDRYLATTPPRVIVVYTVLSDQCPGTTTRLRNLDFRRAPFLQPFRAFVERTYRFDTSVDGECDRAEMFVRQTAGEG
jgi:hypothetical protein